MPMALAEGKVRRGGNRQRSLSESPCNSRARFPRVSCTSCLPDGRTCTFRPVGATRLLRPSDQLDWPRSGTCGIGCRSPCFGEFAALSLGSGVGAVRALEKDVV